MFDGPPLRLALEATSLLGARTGIGAMTRALVDRLATVPGIEVTGLAVSWRGRAAVADELPAGMASHPLQFPARLAHWLWARVDHPRLDGFDVVHGPNFVVPPVAGAASLVSVHDFGPWHDPASCTRSARAYPRLVARALDRGAHVHVDSAFVGREAIEILGVEPERVHHIALGFDPQSQGSSVRGRAMVDGSDYVLALGTIEPRKDHPNLVAAMAEVWTTHPDVRLVVVGPDGWGTPAFDAACARHAVGDRVVRLGYVDQRARADLLAGAACLSFASRYEGFGLPPLEAMAAGTPVVASTAGSLPEICGGAAEMVPPGEPAALAKAITAVIDDRERAAELVRLGRVQTSRFSWDVTAEGFMSLYRHLAEQHQRL
ncbi:MAG: glycosyltransferase family 1 protein [Actinomycetota bacterium]